MIIRRQKKNKLRRHPVTMVESVMVLCVLFLFFFGFLQIMEWLYGYIFCQYSAYYASKGMALGYQDYVTLRAARVAAISISGPPRGNVSAERASDLYRAKSYMTYGDDSGVWYDYWGNINSRTGAQLKISRTYGEEDTGDPKVITARVFLSKAKLLDEGLTFLLGISKSPEPYGRVNTVDYSHYLER